MQLHHGPTDFGPIADGDSVARLERVLREATGPFPEQGHWQFDDYIRLTIQTNTRVELVDGRLELLPMPTLRHQETAMTYCNSINEFARRQGIGRAVIMGYAIKSARNGREPDVVFVLAENYGRLHDSHCELPDLVVEVPSRGKAHRDRDLVDKFAEYAQAGIREYHIADLESRTITVLKLVDRAYVEHGVFTDGQRATSQLLPGWELDVTSCLDAGKLPTASE